MRLDFSKLHLDLSANGYHSKQNRIATDLYEQAVIYPPYLDPLSELLENKPEEIIIEGSSFLSSNYLYHRMIASDNMVTNNYNISGSLLYNILPDLSYTASFRNGYTKGTRQVHKPILLVYETGSLIPNEFGSSPEPYLSKQYPTLKSYSVNNTLSYNHFFGSHQIGIASNYSFYKWNYLTNIYLKNEFPSDSLTAFDDDSSLTSGLPNYDSKNNTDSWYTQLSYNYKNRYSFDGVIRVDRNLNTPNHNNSWTQGLSLGWNIHNESFLEKAEWISILELYGSLHKSNNKGVPLFTHQQYYTPAFYTDRLFGNANYISNTPKLRMEKTNTTNIGLNISILNRSIDFTLNLYKNAYEETMHYPKLPPSTGTLIPQDPGILFFTQYQSSSITTENKGVELSSSYHYQTNTEFGLQVSIIYSKNINEIIGMGNDLEVIALHESIPSHWLESHMNATMYFKPGFPTSSFFLYETNGIIQDTSHLIQAQAHMHNAHLGDMLIVDQNQDSIINDADRIYAGSPYPKFEMGFMVKVNYRKLDLGIQLYYSHGNMIYNGNKMLAYVFRRHKDLYYAWSPHNPDSDIPTAHIDPVFNHRLAQSNYFLEDGTYLRVRSLTLGYTFPLSRTKAGFRNIRIYGSASNPFTFTKYTGYDPEVGGNGLSTRGIDKGSYPVAKNFMIGIQLNL